MRKILRLQALLFIVALFFPQVGQGADDIKDWMYPELQKVGSAGELTLGGTAISRHFHYFTDDPFPKVILWYAQKHGVKKDHELFEKLKGTNPEDLKPFGGTIKNAALGGEQSAASIVVYEFAPNRAHVTIVKEDPENGQTIIVSISGDASKTTVQFVQRLTSP